VLEYTQNYYVPAPGYRGSPRTEEELQAQRARTEEAIATALRDFTGQDFGTDAAQWQDWLRQHGDTDGLR
jgi:hypothetical protein